MYYNEQLDMISAEYVKMLNNYRHEITRQLQERESIDECCLEQQQIQTISNNFCREMEHFGLPSLLTLDRENRYYYTLSRRWWLHGQSLYVQSDAKRTFFPELDVLYEDYDNKQRSACWGLQCVQELVLELKF